MLNLIEKTIYFILVLTNKYLCNKFTEKLLNWHENKMVKKYIHKEINPEKIPTINAQDLTNDKFVELSNNSRNPVLIKGFMKDTRAVENWNLSYLKEKIGEFNINVICKESSVFFKTYSFSEFVDKVENENIYINNNHTILSHFPILFDDIKKKFNHFINTINTNLRNIHIANLFIGYGKEDKEISGSNTHCGGSGNFFCMIHGQKRWTLISPQYSCLLKGRISESGIHAQSLFDMPDIKLTTYPKIFKYLPRYNVVLEPGDILWNAPWWWHRIENSSGLSVGLAIRNNKVTKINLLNNLLYTISGYTYLLYNTWLIGLYEILVLKKDSHFGKSSKENSEINVLYQIEKLIKKYPESVHLDDILID